MDEVGWQALAVALVLAGAGWTWYAAKNRGTVSALRGAGATLLVPAAYLTGTLEMSGEVASAVADWATGFAFSPIVWIGIALGGIGVLLLVVAGWMSNRTSGPDAVESGTATPVKGRTKPSGAPAIDDDLSDIEAILKSRGIT